MNKKRMNKQGAALILSYMAIAILTIFGTALVARSISSSNIARRYEYLSRAFWIAEAGLNQGFVELVNNGQIHQEAVVPYAGGDYRLRLRLTTFGVELSSTGEYRGTTRTVKGYFLLIPYPFDNTLSAGNNVNVGGVDSLKVYGQTRLSGGFVGLYPPTNTWFYDDDTGVAPIYTTIKFSDKDGVSPADQFGDFEVFLEEVSNYYGDEAVVIDVPNELWIFPSDEYHNKKVIIAKGDEMSDSGNVKIIFGDSWEEGQDLTIIATGKIEYIYPLKTQTEASRLSTISWRNFYQTTADNRGFSEAHENVFFAHQDAHFDDLNVPWTMRGNVIANNNVYFENILDQNVYFSDRAQFGDLPPGFELILGYNTPSVDAATGLGKLPSVLYRWQEE